MSNQYQAVTDRIVAMLEAGTRPWSQPWAAQGGGRPLRHDGTPYRGMNVLNLWAAGMARSFTSRHWMTYKKAAELGAQVKKGAKSEHAFYVGAITRTEEGGSEEIVRTIPFLKAYCVFNADEIDGLPDQYRVVAAPRVLDDVARIPACDAFMAQTGATILHGGGRAFYQPSGDLIRLPDFGSFDSAGRYYSVAFHELAHWTGAGKRLDRLSHKIFGSPEYAFEELVAELSASYLCADLGVDAEPREDHAAYLACWLKALKADNRNIFRAASYAEKAAAFLHGCQGVAEEMAA